MDGPWIFVLPIRTYAWMPALLLTIIFCTLTTYRTRKIERPYLELPIRAICTICGWKKLSSNLPFLAGAALCHGKRLVSIAALSGSQTGKRYVKKALAAKRGP